MADSVCVRFAPSPTGNLHLGSVRTALFNWLFARNKGGAYLIRIEDTDVTRSERAFVEAQLASLEWLGLTSDEPIVYQMASITHHKKQIAHLLEHGKAYPCFCPAPIVQRDEQDYKKLGAAKQLSCPCRTKEWSAQDLEQPHAVRFKVPDDLGRIVFDDMVRGPIIFSRDQLDDFVICRREGVPTYNFSVVVDDIAMKITHIIRGEDHISNTPKQILLYKAFEVVGLPSFAHLPLILGPSGNRLSKRDVAVSIDEYREQGICADALFNYLARLGWSHGDQEVFSRDELIKLFSFESVNKKGAIFDPEKLAWLNGVHIREMNTHDLARALEQMKAGTVAELRDVWGDQLDAVLEVYKQRSQTMRQLVDHVILLKDAPQRYDLKLIEKWHTDATHGLLQAFVALLEGEGRDADHIQLFVLAKQLAKQHGTKIAFIAQPVRLALIGEVNGPSVFALIDLLGKAEAIKRVKALIATL